MRTERLSIPALAGLGVVLGAAACSGGDDGTADAKPSCQILWASAGAGAGRYDVYLVEMTRDAWINPGERLFSYDEGVFGMFYDEFDDASGAFDRRGVATAGSFLVTTSLATAPVPGDSIGFADTAGQSYFGLDSAGVLGAIPIASGGKGVFDGVWSDDSDTPDAGSGSASIAIAGSTLDLGTFIRYAQCYDASIASEASASAGGEPADASTTSAASAGVKRSARDPLPIPRFAPR